MRVWADVLNTNGDVIGEGPVMLTSASVTRLLDGSGGLKLNCPATPRSRETMTPGRRVNVWYELDAALYLLGQGIIKKAGLNGDKLGIDCNDLAEQLKYGNTYLNYQIDGETVQAAMSDLVAEYGWTIEASGSATTATIVQEFEGETILKALLTIAESAGVHVRISNRAGRIIEVGDLGDSSGVTLADANAGAGGDEWTGILESLTMEEQGDQLANRILAVGGAFEQEPNVTLEDSTGTDIESVLGRDGNLNYYVEDAASVALYGVRWLYKSYPDIKPLSASGGDRIAASNQLRAASLFDLANLSTLRRNYKGKVRGLTTLLLPGQTVKVMYAGVIYQDDGSIWPGGVLDETLYVNRVETYAGEGGWWQNVDLSNINAQRVDEATDVAISVERSKKA